MNVTADKQSLKKWIDKLEDQVMLKNLKMLKQSTEGKDFWEDLPEATKQAINQGKNQADEGKGISHTDVMQEMDERFPQ